MPVITKPSVTANFSNDVPVTPLLVLHGSLKGKDVRVLKYDGCNTNVIDI